MVRGSENPIFNTPSVRPNGESVISQDHSQDNGGRRPYNSVEYGPNGELYQGSAIRQIRLQKGISTRKLAGLMLWSIATISNIETNNISASSKALSKIADLLGVPVDELKQVPLKPSLIRQKK